MAQYPTEFQPGLVPLTGIDQSELNERGLVVLNGLYEPLAEQLVEASKQPHIVEFCPNDPTSRFGSMEKVAAWQSKGRLALPLAKFAGEGAVNLVGFGWMGPGKPGEDEPNIPAAQTTFAIRIYEEAVGQGNALPYTKAILDANDLLYGNRGVWLEAWADNAAAIRTYEKAGFQQVAESPGVRHGKKAFRVYMRHRMPGTPPPPSVRPNWLDEPIGDFEPFNIGNRRYYH